MRNHGDRQTLAIGMAGLALFVAFSGSAIAAGKISGADIAKHSIAGDRLKPNTLTGAQIKESTLGTVPQAARASSARTASSAATAGKTLTETVPYAGQPVPVAISSGLTLTFACSGPPSISLTNKSSAAIDVIAGTIDGNGAAREGTSAVAPGDSVNVGDGYQDGTAQAVARIGARIVTMTWAMIDNSGTAAKNCIFFGTYMGS